MGIIDFTTQINKSIMFTFPNETHRHIFPDIDVCTFLSDRSRFCVKFLFGALSFSFLNSFKSYKNLYSKFFVEISEFHTKNFT